MRRFLHLAAAVAASVLPLASQAATSEWVGDARGSARLVTAADAVGSASRLDAGLELRLAPGWHTYWRTPGDAGFATTIDWSGSENLAKAELAWPAPERLELAGLQNFVYRDHVVLPITLTLKQPGAPVRLHAEVDYADCAEVCIPYHATLNLALPAGAALPGADAPSIADAASKVPGSLPAAGFRLVSATVSQTGADASLAVLLATQSGQFRSPDLFVEGMDATPPKPDVALDDGGRMATLVVPLPAQAAQAVSRKPLTFTVVDGARTAEFTVTPVPGDPPSRASPGTLIPMLGVAFLGGLILNVMPCVLPVLSLKLLLLAACAGAERRRGRVQLLATAAGVVASFLVIATGLVGLKLAGVAVGWGIQFQQPWFLAAMAAVTALFAASLWGLIPIRVPGTSLAGGARSAHPILESFLAGAFATAMASSCSAPFVGTAVGFALARGPWEIMAIFAALGVGMASPMVGVAAVPGAARRLPRAGPWMAWVPRVLGVALAATALWLFWVLAEVAGTQAALVATAAVAGLLGGLALRRPERGPVRRAGAAFALGMAVVAILVFSVASPPNPTEPDYSGSIWKPFDPDAIQAEVGRGKLVFVDVTAAWCLTCKVNEAAVLDRSPVAERLRAPGVVAMRADWTRPEPSVTAYLHSFGRYGVPLNVVYGPARVEGQPLPELLSSSSVLQAMAQAAGPGSRFLSRR